MPPPADAPARGAGRPHVRVALRLGNRAECISISTTCRARSSRPCSFEARPVTRRRVRFSLTIVVAAIAALIIANKFPSVWTVAFANDRGNLRADEVIE